MRSSFRSGSNAAQVRQLCIASGVPQSVVDSYQYTSLLVFTTTGGNPNLKPEKADTYSAGLVLTPKFGTPLLSNFSASIDYYRIKLAGAVGTISANAILPKCYNGDGSNPGYDASKPLLLVHPA